MRKLLITLTILILAAFGISPALIGSPDTIYMQELGGMPDLTSLNIYFSESNTENSQFDRGNAGVSRFAALLRLMGANTFTLEWRKGIPFDASLIVIPNPRRELTPEMVARLWAYLQRGGRVLLTFDAFDAAGAPIRVPAGLFELTWNDLGIRGRGDVLAVPGDLRTITLTAADGNQTEAQAPLLMTSFLTQRVATDHPITQGLLPPAEEQDNLTSLFFNGARSIELNGALAAAPITPLIFADDAGLYGEANFAEYNRSGFSEFNIGPDTAPGDLILAAAYEDPTLRSRMVLVSDGDFITNGAGFVTSPSYSGSFVYPHNVQFMIRSVAWLLERNIVSIALPTPAPTATLTITPSPTIPPTPTPTATPSGS